MFHTDTVKIVLSWSYEIFSSLFFWLNCGSFSFVKLKKSTRQEPVTMQWFSTAKNSPSHNTCVKRSMRTVGLVFRNLLPIDQMKFKEAKSTVYLWIIAIASDFITQALTIYTVWGECIWRTEKVILISTLKWFLIFETASRIQHLRVRSLLKNPQERN